MNSSAVRRSIIAGLLVTPLVLGSDPAIQDLYATRTVAVAQALGRPAPWNSLILHYAKPGPGGLWLMVAGSGSRQFALMNTDPGGAVRLFKVLPGINGVLGLAVTPTAVAAQTVQAKRASLLKFDLDGNLSQTLALPCALSEGLLVLGTDFASLCPDGMVTKHLATGGEERLPSWGRPGTVVQALTQSQILVADRETGQVLLNDLQTGTLAPLPIAADVQARVAHNRMKTAAAQQREPERRFAPPIVIEDVAGDDQGVYLLLYPYTDTVGPLVIKIDTAGRVLERLQCRPSSPGVLGSFSKMAIEPHQRLTLFTTAAEMVSYPLPGNVRR